MITTSRTFAPLIVVLGLALAASACSEDKKRPSGGGMQTNKCGNGRVDPGESCDKSIPTSSVGACPTACNDGIACTEDRMIGSATACNAECDFDPLAVCMPGDGCCPSNCTSANDGDCSSTCGNGSVDSTETCDGNCPSSCADTSACTTDTQYGSPITCSLSCGYQIELKCQNGDGCCPAACDDDTDSDCSMTCGNQTIEAGETCDGDCPTSCADSNDCTRDLQVGSASNCNLDCIHQAVTTCMSGDECCAPGCNHDNDSDCPASCEGVTSCTAGDGCCPSICNFGNDSDCPLDCDFVVGCTNGDTCCPSGCSSANDNDCPVVGAGEIGDACASATDCAMPPGASAVCNPSTSWPGGYCTFFCTSEPCPSGSTCDIELFQCIKNCTPFSPIECRTDYTCRSGLGSNEAPYDGCKPGGE